MSDEATKKIIDKFFSDMSRAMRGEQVDIFEALHEKITWTMTGSTPISRAYRGLADFRDNIGAALATQFKIGPGFIIYPYEYIVEGNRVAVLARSRGESANGAQYRNSYFMLIEVKDGKIYRSLECYDGSHVMQTAFDMQLKEG